MYAPQHLTAIKDDNYVDDTSEVLGYLHAIIASITGKCK